MRRLLWEASVGPSTAVPYGLAARWLDLDDADAVRALRRLVIGTLADPDHYVPEDDRFVVDHLGAAGQTYGVFDGRELVAFGAIGLPGPGQENLGEALGLPEAQWPAVGHLASAMVRPGKRGIGLHHWLIQQRIDALAERGRHHAIAMVSPRNWASWHNLTRYRFYVKRIATMYGSLTRYLMHRDAAAPAIFAAPVRHCPADDIETQRRLLEDGYWGVDPELTGHTAPMIGYARPLPVSDPPSPMPPPLSPGASSSSHRPMQKQGSTT